MTMSRLGRSAKGIFRGFTLIEMLVVMTIVALLLTLALPRYFGSLDRSKTLVLKDNLNVIRVTIDRFHADKGRYPESLQELVLEGYIRQVPLDPVTESAQTWKLISPPTMDAVGVYDVKSGAPGTDKEGHRYGDF